MKINSITQANIYSKAKGAGSPGAMRRESAYERHNNKQLNNEQINTTIKMQKNSDGRVSFKGGMPIPLLHRIATFTSDNPLVAEALFAILITCGLRPATILATARTEEDKNKCAYQASKSISSGVVGLATTAIVGTLVAAGTRKAHAAGLFNQPDVLKGINKLKEFAEQTTDEPLKKTINRLTEGNKLNLSIFTKEGAGSSEEFLKELGVKAKDIVDDVTTAFQKENDCPNYLKTCKNVMDKLFQPIFMPIRATITTALVPVILNALGLKKTGKNPTPEKNPEVMLNYSVFQTENEKKLFQSFAGVTNNASK